MALEQPQIGIQDHVFVSYAWEVHALAEWLTAKLTCAGYKVWRDQEKLFGGAWMKTDIDVAVEQHTHRMVGRLSSASIEKLNPTKERATATHLSRMRGIPFSVVADAADDTRRDSRRRNTVRAHRQSQ